MSLRTAHNRKNFKLEVSLDEKSHIWRSKPVLLEGLVEKESWITKDLWPVEGLLYHIYWNFSTYITVLLIPKFPY